jgi:DNA-binding transcriptional regulator GbsR (MarR family)
VSPSPYEESRALFIRRWGEMGATWGISRTMAEVHALLFTATEPLCTDDVMEQLHISRGNASMNLRHLQNWGLIHRTHSPRDRKIYFAAETDVWEMFRVITRERQRREVEPVRETIERCRAMVGQSLKSARGDDKNAATYHRRLGEMLEFLKMTSQLSQLISRTGKSGTRRLLTMLSRIIR